MARHCCYLWLIAEVISWMPIFHRIDIRVSIFATVISVRDQSSKCCYIFISRPCPEEPRCWTDEEWHDMHNTWLFFPGVIFCLSMKKSQVNTDHLDSHLNETIRLQIGYQENSNVNSMVSHTLEIWLRKCLIPYIHGRVLLDFGKYGMSWFLNDS